MFKKSCFDTITMLQTFGTNCVSQFWEHFEILKKKIHLNIIINIIYKIYYKEKIDGFSQVWVIYKIYYKQEMMAFLKFESFTKYITRKKMMTFPKFESWYVLRLCELFGIHLCIVLIPICINYLSIILNPIYINYFLS